MKIHTDPTAAKHADRRDRGERKVLARIKLTKKRGIPLLPATLHHLKSMATACSCEMCRNPRTAKGSLKHKLTRQELRFLSAADDV
jgi:hypothetical protein